MLTAQGRRRSPDSEVRAAGEAPRTRMPGARRILRFERRPGACSRERAAGSRGPLRGESPRRGPRARGSRRRTLAMYSPCSAGAQVGDGGAPRATNCGETLRQLGRGIYTGCRRPCAYDPRRRCRDQGTHSAGRGHADCTTRSPTRGSKGSRCFGRWALLRASIGCGTPASARSLGGEGMRAGIPSREPNAPTPVARPVDRKLHLPICL